MIRHLILLGVAGAGTILVGLSPENVNVLFHLIGALNLPAGNAAMILLGLVIWRDRGGPPRGAGAVSGAIKLAWFSVLSGVIGFLGLLSGPILVILTGHGGGLAERIALYPLIIWLIVFGYAILAEKVRASDMSESIQKRRSPTISADGLVADLELPARPR